MPMRNNSASPMAVSIAAAKANKPISSHRMRAIPVTAASVRTARVSRFPGRAGTCASSIRCAGKGAAVGAASIVAEFALDAFPARAGDADARLGLVRETVRADGARPIVDAVIVARSAIGAAEDEHEPPADKSISPLASLPTQDATLVSPA